MQFVIDGHHNSRVGNDAIRRIYALFEADGEKLLLGCWCPADDPGPWELTLDPDQCVFCYTHKKGNMYIYLEPSSESIIVYDNGIQREFVFADGRLIPRLRGIEAE